MRVEGEKCENRPLIISLIMFAKQIPLASNRQQRPPLILCLGRIFHQQPIIYVDQPCTPFRAFEISRQPEQIAGDPSQHGAPITQVSLLPPPCDELTISAPSRKATRVSLPAKTRGLPPNSTNGRKSIWRGASTGLPSVPSTKV